MVESARSDNNQDGCGAFLLCLVDCLLRCLEDILEYFNKYAYIYVGMVSFASVCRNFVFFSLVYVVFKGADTIQCLSTTQQYGYSYLEAGKNVMTLFNQKGWSIIISDNLISNVLSLFCLIIGALVGCVGLIMNEINPSWFEGYEGAAMGIAFG